MPVCFQLTRKGEQAPTPLNTIDKELCLLLGKDVHPHMYVIGWFDCIGFKLAMGCRLDSQEITTEIDDWFQEYPDDDANTIARNLERKHGMLRCLAYLQEHYTDRSWYEHKS
jgi:hypothetical protein